MKVLYLTDNKENYAQGNYYEDWLCAFKKRFPDLIVFGPGYPTSVDCITDDFDLVVYGHSFLDILRRWERADSWGKKRFHGLDFEKFSKTPSILFSKNEYKFMEETVDFVKKQKCCLWVAYTKETLDKYENSCNKICWIPFGINRDRFNNKNLERTIDIGMRGNKLTKYIGSVRIDVADSIGKDLSFLNLDVKLSENGEDFLFGDTYIDWLNRSRFTANTRSAMEMNPKFAEIIACGSIPVCPLDSYEGLLVKDKHYVDIDDLRKIKSKEEFYKFYGDKFQEMKSYLEEFADMYDYDVFVGRILEELNK